MSILKKTILFLTLLQQMTLASDYIEVYSAYTNGKRVLVQGRIIDSEDKKTKKSNLFSAFFNDEKKDITINLKMNNKSYVGQSDNEGYFVFDINLSQSLEQNKSISLETDDKTSLQTISLFQPSSKEHIGIISDFDDTVIVSDVTTKIKLLYNTFFKNFKERKIVSEIEKKIKRLLKENNLSDESALFFISGSPHQFNNNINNFLDYHVFPKRSILTKKIHGEKKDDLQASIAYKYDKIVRLIEMYPQVKWVFFGDSGEKDPSIYLKVRQYYPNSVKEIYIRDVESGKVEKMYNILHPFTSDGCSYFPDGTLKNNTKWLNCCVEHDKSYWKGGTKAERQKADDALKTCVKEVGYPHIAKLMYLGVRLGGSAKYDTSYKWGYGWEINRYNEPLSAEELKQIEMR